MRLTTRRTVRRDETLTNASEVLAVACAEAHELIARGEYSYTDCRGFAVIELPEWGRTEADRPRLVVQVEPTPPQLWSEPLPLLVSAHFSMGYEEDGVSPMHRWGLASAASPAEAAKFAETWLDQVPALMAADALNVWAEAQKEHDERLLKGVATFAIKAEANS